MAARNTQKEVKEIKTVWTDYPVVTEALERSRGPFRLVPDRAAADIVFTPQPCSHFLSLPRCVTLTTVASPRTTP